MTWLNSLNRYYQTGTNVNTKEAVVEREHSILAGAHSLIGWTFTASLFACGSLVYLFGWIPADDIAPGGSLESIRFWPFLAAITTAVALVRYVQFRAIFGEGDVSVESARRLSFAFNSVLVITFLGVLIYFLGGIYALFVRAVADRLGIDISWTAAAVLAGLIFAAVLLVAVAVRRKDQRSPNRLNWQGSALKDTVTVIIVAPFAALVAFMTWVFLLASARLVGIDAEPIRELLMRDELRSLVLGTLAVFVTAIIVHIFRLQLLRRSGERPAFSSTLHTFLLWGVLITPLAAFVTVLLQVSSSR